jgi:Kelch motif
VMSQTQIEKKVEGYLRNSQALEDYWQRPISADQLQAEMERMASHTKQPEVLRELFEAVGNDPFVIAECLARPVLAERLAAGTTVVAGVSPASTKLFAADTAASTENRFRATNRGVTSYTLPVIASPSGGCTDDTWTPTTLINAPNVRSGHTAVWTGSEIIVWGGWDGTASFDTGGRYNPGTDSWTAYQHHQRAFPTNAAHGRVDRH